MSLYFPSEEELSKGGGSDRALLPEEEYIVKIQSWKTQTNSPGEYNKDGHDTLRFDLTPLSFADGTDLEDVDGNVPNDARFFAFIDPTKTGMIPRPSKARKFFAAILNVPVGGPISVPPYDELIGKTLIAAIIHKNGKERVEDFKPIRTRERKRATPAATSAPAAVLPEGEEEELPF